jgi:hypothetical protein
MQLEVDVSVGVGPSLFNNVETLRVLNPYVLKSFDVVSFAGIISIVLIRAKNKQNRVMVRRVARKVVVNSPRKHSKPRRAGTIYVQSLFYVVVSLLIVRPSENIPMVAYILQMTIIQRVLKKVS